MRPLVALPVLIVMAATTAGHAATGDDRQAAADKIAGMKSYKAFCADCHGVQGAGDGALSITVARPVPNFTTPMAVVSYSRERMIAGVTASHAEDIRKAWDGQLDPAQVENVVAYMREAFMLPAPDADASRGRAIFARTCTVCHGDRGNGASWAKTSLNPSPMDFTSAKAKELSRRHMINTVTYGSPNTAMKGFSIQLSRGEIAAVVDYIRNTFVFPEGAPVEGSILEIEKKIASRNSHDHGGGAADAAGGAADRHAAHGHLSGPQDMSLPLPAGLVGDVPWGKQFFDANCAVCHGKKGDGQGPRAYFINPKPANFLSPESREEYNRPGLFQRISDGSPGSEMPAWSKVLTAQEIANVAEYVFLSFIRPEPTTASGPSWEQKKTP